MRIFICTALLVCHLAAGQRVRIQNGGEEAVRFLSDSDSSNSGAGLGKLTKVYEWKQITYNIGGRPLLQDRFGDIEENATAQESDRDGNTPRGEGRGYARTRIAADRVVFRDNVTGTDTDFQSRIPDSQKYFIQYNNVPMGVERWRNKIFITMPRRRYGIPSTLNYLDLTVDTERSPALRPYPDASTARQLVSVYRTRVDECDRLWAVDTGLLEIPDARRQVQPPAVVVFDLHRDRLAHRYQLKPEDLVNESTPGGLASISVDVGPNGCSDTHAYIVDLATYGLIVYSLRENDSWRVSHNFFSFNPLAGRLNIAGQQFSWSDGIFSTALGARDAVGDRTLYFHPMVSLDEFSVSTGVLKNRSLATRQFHGEDFKKEGSRGEGAQSTAHALHAATGALLFAEVGRDAVSCWNVRRPLTAGNKVTLAQDHQQLVYPSDLHITRDEVWLMSNMMPRFIYSTLDTNQYNFRIFRGNVREMIAGTACEAPAGVYVPPKTRF